MNIVENEARQRFLSCDSDPSESADQADHESAHASLAPGGGDRQPREVPQHRADDLHGRIVERGRAVVVTAIERIKAGHFEPAPREIAGTCVTRFGTCPHASVCPYGGAPPE